jgi:putative transposase
MSRGDRREDIFHDDVDRHDFLKTLAEACQKTGFEVHAYCLMKNHFHLVVETPNGNLVAGMRWLLSSYTLRLNQRRKLFGHVFSGRYKALIVDGSGDNYLRTVCDYVHLNPVRAGLLKSEERLLAYPWSSLVWHLASREHRPSWIRTDRLLGMHGIQEDTAAGRRELECRMESRRCVGAENAEWAPVRRGWCLHAGDLRRESAEAKAERIVAEELKRLNWTSADLAQRLKSDPSKLGIATRLRRDTTVTIGWLADRLHLGTWKSASARIHAFKRINPAASTSDKTHLYSNVIV